VHPIRRRHREVRAVEAGLDRAGAIGGIVLEREGDRAAAGGQFSGEPRAVAVVDVDHRVRGREIGEEQALGTVVLLHRLVEVEMVLGQVGEDRGREVDRVGAVKLQRV